MLSTRRLGCEALRGPGCCLQARVSRDLDDLAVFDPHGLKPLQVRPVAGRAPLQSNHVGAGARPYDRGSRSGVGIDCLLSLLKDRPGLIGSVSGWTPAPPQVPLFGTSPLKVRMKQVYEGPDVAGHGLVEGALEVVRFEHAARLYQAVGPTVGGLGVGSGVDGAMVGEDLGLESVLRWPM